MLEVIADDYRTLQDVFRHWECAGEIRVFFQPSAEAILIAIDLKVGAGDDSDDLKLRIKS